MRWLLVLALLVSGCAETVRDTHTLIKGLSAMTVEVVTACPEGTDSRRGSGVRLDNGFIATAYHNVELQNTNPLCVIRVGGREVSLDVYDEGSDVAILYDQRAFNQLGVEFGLIRLGDAVICIGYPQQIASESYGLQVSRGYYLTKLKGTTKSKVDCPFSYGSSGGPIFNEYGELIGIAVSMPAEARIPGEYYITDGDLVEKSYLKAKELND